MSDENTEPNAHADLPDPVDDFSIRVEKQDAGWAVIKHADGEESVITHHPDEESATLYAVQLQGTARRHEGVHREEAVPGTYPGKGVDETGNVPPQSPGA